MELETEFQYFDKNREKFLAVADGQFAVIKGEVLLGFFGSEEEAYKAAMKKCGLEPFLIKEVLPEDPIEQIPAYHLGLMNATV